MCLLAIAVRCLPHNNDRVHFRIKRDEMKNKHENNRVLNTERFDLFTCDRDLFIVWISCTTEEKERKKERQKKTGDRRQLHWCNVIVQSFKMFKMHCECVVVRMKCIVIAYTHTHALAQSIKSSNNQARSIAGTPARAKRKTVHIANMVKTCV